MAENKEEQPQRDLESLVLTVKKDMRRLLLSGIVAVIAAIIVNMLINIS